MLDKQTFKDWLSEWANGISNDLEYSRVSQPKRVEKLTLNLATASDVNGLKVPVPFKSMLISRIYSTATPTTDKAGSIKVLFDQNNLANLTNAVSMFANDSFTAGKLCREAFLTWDAQSDTSIDIYFFPDIDFRPGTTKTQIVGTVTVTATQAAAVATKTVPSLVTRLVGNNATASYTVRAGYYALVYWAITGSTTNTGSVSVGGVVVGAMNGAGGANFALSGQSQASAGDIVSAVTNAAGSSAYVQIVEIPV